MLHTVTLPLIYEGSGANGNWELSMLEAMLGIAVFSDNTTLFDHTVGFWQQRLPAYFYYHTDGDHPVPPPRGYPSWYNQSVFNASVDGVCQETCRDFGHTQMGFASAINGAQTAFLQGVDLFTPMVDRLAAAMEFHANFLLGAPVPDIVCNGTGVHLAYPPTFEIAYYQVHGRLGRNLPLSWRHITTQVRQGQDLLNGLIMVYETLTHGLAA
jgi:hypothetical protein